MNPQSGYRPFLHAVCEDTFDRLLAPTIETDVRMDAKKKADLEAIKVFQTNLDHLLLAPPAGQRCTLGVDPGIRTGCKLAIINRLGQFMEIGHHLSPGTQAGLRGQPGHPGAAGRQVSPRSHRHRQRHRRARGRGLHPPVAEGHGARSAWSAWP